jgi:tRNA-dihydrouridine synthase
MVLTAIGKTAILSETPDSAEVLDKIVTRCLWHEPHSLHEILQKLEKGNEPSAASRRVVKSIACSTLREAIAAGHVRREKGFFLLTLHGRTTWQKRSGLSR